MVARFRLFCRRPLVARRSLPGRAGPLCLAVAARRDRTSVCTRLFHGRGLCPGELPLVIGRRPHPRAGRGARLCRVAARQRAHRLSVEFFRHGFGRQSRSRAIFLLRRALRIDHHRHRHFCRAGNLDRQGPRRPVMVGNAVVSGCRRPRSRSPPSAPCGSPPARSNSCRT